MPTSGSNRSSSALTIGQSSASAILFAFAQLGHLGTRTCIPVCLTGTRIGIFNLVDLPMSKSSPKLASLFQRGERKVGRQTSPLRKRRNGNFIVDENGNKVKETVYNDPLEWWSRKKEKYQTLWALARKYLAIPAT